MTTMDTTGGLDHAEMLRLLRASPIARIAFTVDDQPYALPVNCACDEHGRVVFRTGDHSLLGGLAGQQVGVEVDGDDPGDAVTFRFAANPGEELAPLARVASGGELARTMLALRLVITEAPPTLVFDEVDAGIGGEAALAVGRALARLGAPHQVLVVTHLAQVAAYADAQVAVDKREDRGRTLVTAASVDGEARAIELSRMLSGMPSSTTAREHAEELLAAAARDRNR